MLNIADFDEAYANKPTNVEQIPVGPFMPGNLDASLRDDAMSLWTHRVGTDAMYLALFKKSSE